MRIFINIMVQLAITFLLVLSTFTLAQAHDPGLSAAQIRLSENELSGRLTFARSDIEKLVQTDANGDGKLSSEEFAKAQPKLQALAGRAFEIRFDEQTVAARDVKVSVDESDAVHFDFVLPLATNYKVLNLRSNIIASLSQGHRQYFTLLNEEGQKLNEQMLDARNSAVEIDLQTLTTKGRPQSFGQFLLLGIEHILTGYDHLAFLFALLLLGGKFSDAAKIITSFTLAHSITLALATFNLVGLSPSIVEPLIAVSIIYVGLENIFRREMKRRWLLTFGFGLIHGLGFATVLRELGIGASAGQTILPLLSFNLGVEMGQIAIAALILPLIWKLRERNTFALRYVPACSVLLVLLGGYWFVQRVLG
jgi:hydrogenase/urease accessory protein HupE